MLHAIIMAGGRGTRLWPESTPKRPKQFLAFQNDTPMIRACYDSLFGMVDSSRINIATTPNLVALVQEAIPTIRLENVILEPFSKNTAPCIALAAVFLLRNDPDATMIVLPSDHIIEPVSKLKDSLRFAAELVEVSPDELVTIGVKPNFPSTAFGYIERDSEISTPITQKWENLTKAYEVKQFREKPDIETAETFLANGHFFWNTGIFVWKAQRILELIDEFQPDLGKRMKTIAKSVKKTDFSAILEKEYREVESISIDYAVMEHVSDVVCLEAPFRWNDMGNWTALSDIDAEKHDKKGNLANRGKLLAIDSQNNVIRLENPEQQVALVGVENLIVIQTQNGLLIADKNSQHRIGEVVTMIESGGPYCSGGKK